jgi:class 3 adenylate cyclase
LFEEARCAVSVQRALRDYNDRHADAPVRIRIGLHCGEAIREAGDFFGRNVVLAARIASRAGGEEILVSASVYERAADMSDVIFGLAADLELKGLAGTHIVRAVDWRR